MDTGKNQIIYFGRSEFIRAFAVTALLCTAFIFLFEGCRVNMERNRMVSLALEKSARIKDVILAPLYKVEALSALVVQANGDVKDFDRVAPIIIDDPAIRNILIAPNGVVTHVYPMTGNKEVIGLDFADKKAGNKEASLAVDTGKLTLGGPFKLVQGGMALVGRLPVYTSVGGRSKLWGLVSVTLRYPAALNPVDLSDIRDKGYVCKIWRINPDDGKKQVILESNSEELRDPIEQKFSILNAKWVISIAPRRRWYESPLVLVYFFGTLLISTMLAFTVQNYCDMKMMQKKLEKLALYDDLTGLPNRRYFIERLNEYIDSASRSGGGLALCYFDVDGFKSVNDTYGHKCGNIVLTEIARRVCAAAPRYFVARIGGDEFTVLAGEALSDEGLSGLSKAIKESLTEPIGLNQGDSVKVSVSVGTAMFPTDGTDADELLVYADKVMYREKTAGRKA